MSKYDRIKKERDRVFDAAQKQVGHRQTIADELTRVASIANNSGEIISDLDRQFAKLTKLNGVDIALLWLATALQCARQYLLSNEKLRLKHDEGDKLMSKIVPKKWQNILLSSVPYDAVWMSDEFKDKVGSIGIGGNTHRYRTLGHDPVLGWIFGTVNILSDSLTKTDFISTYQVNFPYITGTYPGGTVGAFQAAMQQAMADKYNLPAAIVRQALHFGSDYFTKQGLPLPFLSSINNDLAKDFLTKYNIDMWSVTRGAALASLINTIIACIHRLFYNEAKDGESSLYEVRTRKILSYSNTIASGSNIIYVALSKDLQKLDVGGILVTLYRLIFDYKFIQEVKLEFISNKWNELVTGSDIEI